MQPYAYAIVYLGLGDHERMYEWLDRAVQARSEDLVFLQVEIEFDPVRSDPRFIAVLHQMNFDAAGRDSPSRSS